MGPARPARSAQGASYLAMDTSDDDDDQPEDNDASDFEGEGSESSSDDDMDEDLDEEDSPVVKKKRGPVKPAAAAKAAPPAKKPKPSAAKGPVEPKKPAAALPSPSPMAAPPAPDPTPQPPATPVGQPKAAAAPPSSACSTASSSSAASSSAPSTEKKKKAPAKTPGAAKPAAPKKAATGSGSTTKASSSGKEAAVKNPGEASTIILDYLTSTNRPYGSQNVFDNLHRRIPLPIVKAQLDSLADAGRINRKEYGKNKVYYVKQEESDAGSSGLGDWEAKGKAVKEEREGLMKRKAELDARVRGLTESMTDEQLAEALEKITRENAEREVKLKELRALSENGAGQISQIKNSLATLRETLKKLRSTWVTRKRNLMEAVAEVADSADRPPKKLIDDVGIETDEECGSLPPQLP